MLTMMVEIQGEKEWRRLDRGDLDLEHPSCLLYAGNRAMENPNPFDDSRDF